MIQANLPEQCIRIRGKPHCELSEPAWRDIVRPPGVDPVRGNNKGDSWHVFDWGRGIGGGNLLKCYDGLKSSKKAATKTGGWKRSNTEGKLPQ